jgi:hypothetical protein
MNKKYLTGIVALLVVTVAALLGAGVVAEIVTPPATVVNNDQFEGGETNGPITWPDAPADQLSSGGSAIFGDDFAGDLDGWRALDPADDVQPARWRILKGKLLQDGDHMGDWSEYEAVLWNGDAAWNNYTFQAQGYVTSGSPFGLCWRAGNEGMYRVLLHQNLPNASPKAELQLITPIGGKVLAKAPVSVWPGYEPAQWHTLRVTTTGASQQVWVNGVQIFDVQDDTLKAGQIGLYAISDGAAAFDNVRVSE